MQIYGAERVPLLSMAMPKASALHGSPSGTPKAGSRAKLWRHQTIFEVGSHGGGISRHLRHCSHQKRSMTLRLISAAKRRRCASVRILGHATAALIPGWRKAKASAICRQGGLALRPPIQWQRQLSSLARPWWRPSRIEALGHRHPISSPKLMRHGSNRERRPRVIAILCLHLIRHPSPIGLCPNPQVIGKGYRTALRLKSLGGPIS
jgi:hypothetical protein